MQHARAETRRSVGKPLAATRPDEWMPRASKLVALMRSTADAAAVSTSGALPTSEVGYAAPKASRRLTCSGVHGKQGRRAVRGRLSLTEMGHAITAIEMIEQLDAQGVLPAAMTRM